MRDPEGKKSRGASPLSLDCWICGASADSAEHKIKKSDLRRLYGRGPYRGTLGVDHFREGLQRTIQGPDAADLKFRKSLCKHCNGARTQPYDRAYDRLCAWVMQHEATVLQSREIELADALGRRWRAVQWSLLRYFAKSLGCQLRESGAEVPEEIVQLVRGRDEAGEFRLSFAVSKPILRAQAGVKFAGVSALYAHRQRETGLVTGFHSARQYQWLFVWVLFNHWPTGTLGALWACDDPKIKLGVIDK